MIGPAGKIPLFTRAELIEPDIESLKAPNIREPKLN